jgi:hypothetical protein
MTTTIDLSPEEQTLLAVHLDRHLHHLDAELVRTEKHDLAHALAREIDQLRAIVRRLETGARS